MCIHGAVFDISPESSMLIFQTQAFVRVKWLARCLELKLEFKKVKNMKKLNETVRALQTTVLRSRTDVLNLGIITTSLENKLSEI